jgi:arabinofuranosyltransferase
MKVIVKYFFCLLPIFVILILHAYYLNCVAEDAFISFRFAKNLVNGYGLVWNVGETPVEGYTNFIWVLLCALGLKLGFNISVFAQMIGLIASLLTLIYVFMFANKLFKCKPLFSLIPCMFLAVSGPFATWAESGMETNLFGLLVLIGCYYFTYSFVYGSKKELYYSFLAILVATLTRPEGFMIFCIFLGLSLFLSRTRVKSYLGDFSLPILIYIIPFSIYFIWRVHYFGYLLPNTYYAKTGGSLYQYLRGWTYTLYFVIFFVLPFLPLIVLYFWMKKNDRSGNFYISQYFRELFFNNVGFYLCSTIILVYTLYIIFVGGDYMAMYRFFVPILPEMYLVIGFIVNFLFCQSESHLKKKALLLGMILFSVTGTLFQSTPWEMKFFAPPPFLHGSYRGVLIERWHSARLSVIGKFFNDYKKSSNESLATGAIGAVSYYSDMKIYDPLGLVDPYIAHKKLHGKYSGWGLPGHEKEDLQYTLSKNPTYIMFNRDLTKNRLDSEEQQHDLYYLIKDRYKVKSVWLVDDANKEEGYFNFLELKIHN